MSVNPSIKTVFRYLNNSGTDRNSIEVSSDNSDTLQTIINIEISNNRETTDSAATSSEISITTMDSSDDEFASNSSNSSLVSMELMYDQRTQDIVPVVARESFGSNRNQVIEINETQHNTANEDVIEIIDLCATQMPLPNLNISNRSRSLNNSVIEIFDSPSVLRAEAPSLRRSIRNRCSLPYEVSPRASCSQSRRSQIESPITCPICLENVRNHSPVSTTCGHIFCKECLRQALQSVKKCPMCKKSLTRTSQYHDIYI